MFEVNLYAAAWKKFINMEFIELIVGVVFAECGVKDKYVSILMADDSYIKRLNRQYRGVDKPTNVLSFPDDVDDNFLGDIAIALETIITESKDVFGESKDVSVKNHTAHMLVHGILHLLGYDHDDQKEAEAMESLEIKILAKLNIKNPY